jgi:hypothetical protein
MLRDGKAEGIPYMNSPLARVILAVLCGYLIILLLLSVYDWVVEEFPRRPAKPPSSARIQHPLHHGKALKALQLFSRMPKPEKDAIRKSLKSNLISMDQWLTYLDQSDYQIMCLGELHEEATRIFLAEEFFTKIAVDVLLLEATPSNLKRLIKRMDAGRDYFPLLDADIMKLLRTAKKRNPAIKIWGIEETDEQQKKKRRQSNPRDQSIANNFWDKFQPGRRHIILFGAIHCTNESNWLFKNLCRRAPLTIKERIINVQVLGEHQNGHIEAFVYFLDEIGIEKKTFIIPDTSALHPHIYELFQSLNRQNLAKYRCLVVFRV